MSVTTADLAAWLTQVWDELEAIAREAYYEGQVWLPEEESVVDAPDWDIVHTADRKADARHIVEWQPSVALARIAADRKILARCMRIWSEDEDGRPLAELVRAVDAGLIVHDLASGYADRPGYPMERP